MLYFICYGGLSMTKYLDLEKLEYNDRIVEIDDDYLIKKDIKHMLVVLVIVI
mgnify:CR=1 FL=1